MAQCLVTGGAGFLGSHLVDALVARGEAVRVLDDLRSGSRDNLARVADQIALEVADLADWDALHRAMRDVEVVFHFAAPPDRSDDAFREAVEPEFGRATETLRVLTAARDAGVRRVVFASSGRVYGGLQSASVRESDSTVPLTHEGLLKLIGEHHCTSFTERYGLETVRLRYFNVFGPRQSPGSAYARGLPNLLRALLAGPKPMTAQLHDADQDWLYIDDAIYATLLAADHRRAAGKVYNIARGRSASLTQIAAILDEIFRTTTHIVPDEETHAPLLPRGVNIARAETELGFCPRADLKQDLLHFVARMTGQTVDELYRTAATPAAQGPHFREQAALARRPETTDAGKAKDLE